MGNSNGFGSPSRNGSAVGTAKTNNIMSNTEAQNTLNQTFSGLSPLGPNLAKPSRSMSPVDRSNLMKSKQYLDLNSLDPNCSNLERAVKKYWHTYP